MNPHSPDRQPDRTELSELCKRHYPAVQDRVHRLLARDMRRGRPWLSAMLSTGDIVHEVFLGVVRDFEGFRGTSDQQFVAYLARLVRNRLVDSVRYHEASRRDARKSNDQAPELAQATPGPAEHAIYREEVESFQRALASMPERDRALLRGRVEDGESFASLSRALGYASADSTRKAFTAVKARLLAKMYLSKEQQR